MAPQEITRERIKNRLLQRSAQIWGFLEKELNSFDPLVNLLIEACAVEFEKVYKDIVFSQNRVLERLAQVMVPDVLDCPRPAYGVLKVNPVDTDTVVTPDTQFVFRRPADPGRGGRPAQEYFFSPLGSHRLFGGRLRFLVHGQTLTETDGPAIPIRLINPGAQTADYQVLWMGLEVNRTGSSPLTLPPLTFFFDWTGDSDKESFHQQLPACQWFAGNTLLTARTGLPRSNETVSLGHAFDAGRRVEKQIESQLNAGFVQVNFAASPPVQTEKYPPAFEHLFSKTDLQQFKQEMVWLRVVFPQLQATDWLSRVVCAVNCIPVLNRKLHRLSYRLQPSVNIIPLSDGTPATMEHFLSVREVRNSQDYVYSALAAVESPALPTGSYTLRQQGEGRFNSLEAREMLAHLLGLLRDESASFAALGEDFLASSIRDLDQTLARLQQKIGEGAGPSASPYLLIKPAESSDTVFVEYWTTQAAEANHLPAGTRLSVYAGAILDQNEGLLMTLTTGGKERPRDLDKVQAYKRALLTRNRVVTPEDVKALCFDELGPHLKEVQVNRRLLKSTAPGQGFVRFVEVILSPRDGASDYQWRSRCEQLRHTLEEHSVGTLPYRVVMQETGP